MTEMEEDKGQETDQNFKNISEEINKTAQPSPSSGW